MLIHLSVRRQASGNRDGGNTMAEQKRGMAGSEAQRAARGETVGANVDQPVSAAELARSLKGIDFPANRDDLIKHAQRNDARPQVIDRLRGMAQKEYVSLADVEHEFHEAKAKAKK